MTNERERPVRQYFWSPDSKRVLFIQDKGGDENFLLYGVDVATGKQVTLTPFKKTRAEIVGASNVHKDRILVGLNNRDAKWHDVYSLNLDSGKLTLVQRNNGYASFLADNDLKLRMALKSRDDGGTDYYRIANGKIEAKPFASVGLEDLLTHQAGRLHRRRQDALLDRQPRPEHRRARSLKTSRPAARRVVAESPKADISDALAEPQDTARSRPIAREYLKPEWSALDKDIGATLEWLKYKLGASPVDPGANRRRRQVDRQRRSASSSRHRSICSTARPAA